MTTEKTEIRGITACMAGIKDESIRAAFSGCILNLNELYDDVITKKVTVHVYRYLPLTGTLPINRD